MKELRGDCESLVKIILKIALEIFVSEFSTCSIYVTIVLSCCLVFVRVFGYHAT